MDVSATAAVEKPRLRYYVKGSPEPPAETPERITVASYNVENLFDGVADRGGGNTPPKSEDGKRAVGRAIAALDADVVALQEVENQAMLDELADRWVGEGRYPYRLLLEGNDRRGIDVAVLSRWPIASYQTHVDDRFPVPEKGSGGMSRDLLHARIRAGAFDFTLFNTHLKAGEKPSDQRKRTAEAEFVRRTLEGFGRENPGAHYLLAGDLNAGPQSPTLGPLLGDGSPLLVDPWAGTREADAYTHPTDGGDPRCRMDYVLASPAMGRHVVPGSARIHRGVDEAKASDHFPVSVEISTRHPVEDTKEASTP